MPSDHSGPLRAKVVLDSGTLDPQYADDTEGEERYDSTVTLVALDSP